MSRGVRVLSIGLLLLCLPLSIYAQTDFTQIDDILLNLERQYPAIMRLLVALSYVMGIWFIMLAIFKLIHYGTRTVFNMSQTSMTGTLAYFFIGVMMLWLPLTFVSSVETLWGAGGYDYAMANPYLTDLQPRWANIMNPLIGLVRIVGLIAFIKGWAMMTKAGSQGGQPGQLSKAFMHIIGGVLALNIVVTIEVIKNTFLG